MTTPTNNQTSAKSPLFATTQAPAVPTAPTVPTAPSVPAAPTFQQDVYTPTAPTAVAPQTTGLGGVINGLFSAIGKIFSGLFNFFKRLFGAPAGSAPGAVVGTPTTPGATTTPPTVPTVPTTPTTPVTTTPPVVTPTPATNTPPVTTVPTVPVTTEPPVLAPPPPPPPPLPPAPPPPPPVAPPPPPPIAPEAPPTPPVVAVPPTAPETPTPPTTPTAPTGGELNAEEAAIAQQQGIQANRANFDAFIAEAKKLETQNAIGPGTTETAAVQELQTLLAGWGYPVTANGQFDQATIDAVLKFKRDNNLTSPYKMADGSPGVHPFIDEAAKAAMIAKLQGTAPATPATPATPTPTPSATTDPAQPTAPATPATPATPTTSPTTGTLTAEESAIAQQQGILATKANFDAFIAEAKALETQNAIGPGTTETAAVQELQTLLAGWGYTVTPSGQFDQATIDAVLKFKRDNNLTSGYQMADGTPGVHPFIDEKAKAAMIAKLQGTAPAAPATTPTPAATPTPAPATVTTPQFQAPTSTAPLSAEETAIAQQQGIEASRANFDAFMGEAKALETQNALGPGTTETTMVTELQQVLAQFGYPVTQNGQFDQQTVDAVLKFKRDNGIQAPYKMADGTAGVHPFIDERTKAVMIQKLGG